MKKIKYGIISIAVLALIVGCARPSLSYQTGGMKSDNYAQFMKEYQAMPDKKAMAMAKNKQGSLVYGYAHSRQSFEEAKRVAMEQCEMRKKDAGLKATCKIHKVGN